MLYVEEIEFGRVHLSWQVDLLKLMGVAIAEN